MFREGGGEVRVLVGRNLGERGFVNFEAAGRVLKGGCSAQKLDLTLGYRPSQEWLFMGQVFSDRAEGGEGIAKIVETGHPKAKCHPAAVRKGHLRRTAGRIDGDSIERAVLDVGLDDALEAEERCEQRTEMLEAEPEPVAAGVPRHQGQGVGDVGLHVAREGMHLQPVDEGRVPPAVVVGGRDGGGAAAKRIWSAAGADLACG